MNVNLKKPLSEILFITSYPPRECGIATYSQDLVQALHNKFNHSFTVSICPLESEFERNVYNEDVKYKLNTSIPNAFVKLAFQINRNENINMVLLQHEFGFFANKKLELIEFLNILNKPVTIVFHTVLPKPNEALKEHILCIDTLVESIVVMTHSSQKILNEDYGILKSKVTVIPHGTHLVPHTDKQMLKEKYNLSGKTILSTFGLLSSGKSIETTLDALPEIVSKYKNILFLVIGKTHPSVVKHEGESYRMMLEEKVERLILQKHVKFINQFVPLPELLEYLQLTDIYLFTSKDPNQAVSGTFSYAISCGCPIVSTPIPHAREVLKEDAGIFVDFENSQQLAKAVLSLLDDEELRHTISTKGLHTIASTAWENAAIAHALLFEKTKTNKISLHYSIPVINLNHIKKLTTDFGMIQFSKLNQPDLASGYTLDDNARALIALCEHFQLTTDLRDIEYIQIYFDFIVFCFQPENHFLNYVSIEKMFSDDNKQTNLADANGRAVWALGYLLSIGDLLPQKMVQNATIIFDKALINVHKIYSTRAMAFVIKGLYYRNRVHSSFTDIALISELSNRLVQMYRHEADINWHWFESYLTYANSILPEAMLCAWLSTGKEAYKEIAKSSFDFLLSKTFKKDSIKVISNKGWLHNGVEPVALIPGGEQPIDVAYTIIALNKFYNVFKEESYLKKVKTSFDWFLGKNHLHQVIYNPCTGGCYDGLEENNVNLNQGAESTISYLLARLTLEVVLRKQKAMKRQKEDDLNRSKQLLLV